eukprot:1158424-Pelagomonas_calceolata.AAC.1
MDATHANPVHGHDSWMQLMDGWMDGWMNRSMDAALGLQTQHTDNPESIRSSSASKAHRSQPVTGTAHKGLLPYTEGANWDGSDGHSRSAACPPCAKLSSVPTLFGCESEERWPELQAPRTAFLCCAGICTDGYLTSRPCRSALLLPTQPQRLKVALHSNISNHALDPTIAAAAAAASVAAEMNIRLRVAPKPQNKPPPVMPLQQPLQQPPLQ